MALTRLDEKTALIVIDLQKGVAGMAIAHPSAEIVSRAAALAEAFRRRLPVVLVNVDSMAPGRTEQAPNLRAFPADWTELVPELNRRPTDHTVTKRTWGAFTGTGLNEHLRGLGVTEVVIPGIATSAGVESTARQEHELGYNVALAVDAMTDRSAEAHANSVARIFPRLGETGTTEEIIALLEANAAAKPASR